MNTELTPTQENNSPNDSITPCNLSTFSVEKRLSVMKKIVCRKKIAIGGQKYYYKSSIEKYKAITACLDQFDPTELDLIEILIDSELKTWQNLDSFKSFLSLFISSLALMVSVSTPYLNSLFTKISPESGINASEGIYSLFALGCIFAILTFAGIDRLCHSKLKPLEYLSLASKKHKENKKEIPIPSPDVPTSKTDGLKPFFLSLL